MPNRRRPKHPVTPAVLRERAEEFHRLAEAAHDEVIHQELLRLADTYRREAEELDRRGGAASGGGIKHKPYLAAFVDGD